MTPRILEGIRRLQEYLLEIGLARSVVALPAPRMLSLPSPSSIETSSATVFSSLISEAEISDVCRDLFVSGHYSLAVQEAYKAVDRFVKKKAKNNRLSGTKLMEVVFSPDTPLLFWSDRDSESKKDEQRGYQRLYSGAMLGIRNPVSHEFNWVEDSEAALELIVFAQHLLRKAKSAYLSTDI